VAAQSPVTDTQSIGHKNALQPEGIQLWIYSEDRVRLMRVGVQPA
jgi:hypothetical protein